MHHVQSTSQWQFQSLFQYVYKGCAGLYTGCKGAEEQVKARAEESNGPGKDDEDEEPQ